MANFYIYLISSLPVLHFGAKSPVAFEKFLELCQRLIPEEESGILKIIPQIAASGFAYEGSQLTLKNFCEFETTLRNEWVKIRASRKKVDAARYLRREGYAQPWITHVAYAAHRSSSLLEGEKILDEERWRYLGELEVGHYFDFDFLIIYAHKLLILERWEMIRNQDSHKLLEGVLHGD